MNASNFEIFYRSRSIFVYIRTLNIPILFQYQGNGLPGYNGRQLAVGTADGGPNNSYDDASSLVTIRLNVGDQVSLFLINDKIKSVYD